MATIMMQFGAGGGEHGRRCDATCHTAKEPACQCVCGGRYHGKGSSDAAREQMTKDYLGEQWREDKARIEAGGGNYADCVVAAFKAAGAALPPRELVRFTVSGENTRQGVLVDPARP